MKNIINSFRNCNIDKEEWRMNGLNFSEYNNYYPLPQFDDLKAIIKSINNYYNFK